MRVIPYFEETKERRKRLNSEGFHGQPLKSRNVTKITKII